VAIAAEHVSKRFGHVEALRDASIKADYGEVVALFGDNGAGKSTFLRILQGIYRPDNGKVMVADEYVTMHSVRDAQQLGVDTVHQDLSLAPDLSVIDNMFLGHEVRRTGPLGGLGVLDRKEMGERTQAALSELGINLPSLNVPIRDLSGGQRQAVVEHSRPDGRADRRARRPPVRTGLQHDAHGREPRPRRGRRLARPSQNSRRRRPSRDLVAWRRGPRRPGP
jgi:ABC-type sugar transport system ATPase subunit